MIKTPFISRAPEQTIAFAEEVASTLKPGSIVALYGDPGAGKTCFTRGLAKAMGITGPITSPTYTLIHEYASQPPLYHMDLYRLTGIDDLYSLGLDEYFESEGITVIEWADRVEPLLPMQTVRIWIELKPDPDVRMITLKDNT